MQKQLAQSFLLFGLLLLAACGQSAQTVPATTSTPVNLYIGTLGDASSDAAVLALSGATGQPLWKHTTGSVANSTPVLDHGVAYVGSDNSLYALSMQDDKPLWSYATPKSAKVLGIANGLVYGTTNVDNPALYALDPSTGKARWTYDTPDAVVQTVLADGVIYATIETQNCHCANPPSYTLALNASDGTIKWQTPKSTDIFSLEGVRNGLLYGYNFTALDTQQPLSPKLQARKSSDGTVVWQFPQGKASLTPIGIDSRAMYLLAYEGDLSTYPNGLQAVYALNPSTGATLWRAPLASTKPQLPFLVGQTIYLGTADGSTLTALSPSDGKQLWQAMIGTPSTDDRPISVSAAANGLLYLATETDVLALKESSGALAWKSPTKSASSIVAIHNGVLYATTSSTDITTSGQNAVLALKASDGSALWSYQVPGVFFTPAVG